MFSIVQSYVIHQLQWPRFSFETVDWLPFVLSSHRFWRRQAKKPRAWALTPIPIPSDERYLSIFILLLKVVFSVWLKFQKAPSEPARWLSTWRAFLVRRRTKSTAPSSSRWEAFCKNNACRLNNHSCHFVPHKPDVKMLRRVLAPTGRGVLGSTTSRRSRRQFCSKTSTSTLKTRPKLPMEAISPMSLMRRCRSWYCSVSTLALLQNMIFVLHCSYLFFPRSTMTTSLRMSSLSARTSMDR